MQYTCGFTGLEPPGRKGARPRAQVQDPVTAWASWSSRVAWALEIGGGLQNLGVFHDTAKGHREKGTVRKKSTRSQRRENAHREKKPLTEKGTRSQKKGRILKFALRGATIFFRGSFL